MNKSEILEEAKKYLVPVYINDRICYICNAVQFAFEEHKAEVREIVEFIQSTLDASDEVLRGCSIRMHTLEMSDKERYELRLMFMDFLILMYQDEESTTTPKAQNEQTR